MNLETIKHQLKQMFNILLKWDKGRENCYLISGKDKNPKLDNTFSQFVLENDQIDITRDKKIKKIIRPASLEYIIVKNVSTEKPTKFPLYLYTKMYNTTDPTYYAILIFPFKRRTFTQCLVTNHRLEKGSRFLAKLKNEHVDIVSHISHMNIPHDDIPLMTEYYKQSCLVNNQQLINSYKSLFYKVGPTDVKYIDLTHLDTFYIDPENSRDHDDALTIVEGEKESIIYIHIVDITGCCKYSSKMDIDAMLMNQTLYVDYMNSQYENLNIYPPQYSCDEYSLTVGEKRKVITTEIRIDKESNILSTSIYPSWIIVKNGYSYAVEKFYNDKASFIHRFLKKWDYPSLSIQSVDYTLDDNGEINKLIVYKKSDIEKFNSKFIETTMILDNCIVSTGLEDFKLDKNQRWFLERYHPTPRNKNPELGIISNEYKDFIQIKQYTSAIYSTDEKSHFGLRVSGYTHFTSPIRRYFDSLVHRCLEMRISGREINDNFKKNIDIVVNHCNNRQSLNKNIINYLRKIHKWRYILKNSTENWKAVITKCGKTGIDALIVDVGIEVKINAEELSNSRLFFDKNVLYNDREKYQVGTEIVLTKPYSDLVSRFEMQHGSAPARRS